MTALRELVASEGLLGAARKLDLPRHTVAMGAAGAAQREGTRMLVAERVRQLKATQRICATAGR